MDARLTLVIGETDTGKTSLLTRLAGALAGLGLRVAVVDADLGQSEIGPPTTIGLGRVGAPLARLGDAELLALHFVGATSPALDPAATVTGTKKLVDRARADGYERVLVDTCGLVAGALGRTLKQGKIALVDPDLVICLQRGDECEHILRPYDGLARPAIVRLPVPAGLRSRPSEERRSHRQRALDAYFAAAGVRELDLTRVVLRGAGDGVALEGALVGLEDARGDTLGIGWVRRAEPARGRLAVETPVAGDAIAAVAIGREPYRRALDRAGDIH